MSDLEDSLYDEPSPTQSERGYEKKGRRDMIREVIKVVKEQTNRSHLNASYRLGLITRKLGEIQDREG